MIQTRVFIDQLFFLQFLTCPPKEIARKYGVHENTLYAWRRKFGDMDVSEARRLRILEEENRRLKKLVADQALDIQILKEVNSKNW